MRPTMQAAWLLFCLLAFYPCNELATAQSKALDEAEFKVFSGFIMGTTFRVKVVKPKEGSWQPKLIERKIGEALARVDAKMSTYRKESELSRFNQFEKVGIGFGLSAETLFVMQKGLDIFKKSQGAFDMTVGPLVNRWGFGPEPDLEKAPSQKEILELKKQIGSAHLSLDLQKKSAVKKLAKLYVDLSSIAKGYGVDAVGLALEEMNLGSYMVEVGGEIRARGKRQDGKDWQIAIERPSAEKGGRSIHRIIALVNQSIATSGDYRNYEEYANQKVSHIIDPRSGMPVKHGTAAVTVVAPDCMDADAWATAMRVLGPIEGVKLADAHRLSVLFLVREQNSWKEIESKAFHANFSKPSI